MIKDLLPIGSVVMLRNAKKPLMIFGIKQLATERPDEEFDYIGVMYPEGFLSAEHNFLFNQDDINDIVFTGYNNPERESFIEFMEEAYNSESFQK